MTPSQNGHVTWKTDVIAKMKPVSSEPSVSMSYSFQQYLLNGYETILRSEATPRTLDGKHPH
jgi:hypothetical protein